MFADYPRYLHHTRRLAIAVTNDADGPIQVTRLQLQADHFELEPPEDKPHAVISVGSRVDLQVDFGALTTCEPDDPLAAAVEIDIIGPGATEPVTHIVELDAAPLDEILERECGRIRIDEALVIQFGDDIVVDGLDLTTALALTRQAGDPAVMVESVRGSVLIDLDAEPSSEPVVALDPESASVSVPVRFHVFRCEPHAVAASTKTYEFLAWVALDGAAAASYVLPLSDPLRSALEGLIQSCIATQPRE